MKYDRPAYPPGAEIMCQAYDAFEAWCREYDPEGDFTYAELAPVYAGRTSQISGL